MNSLIKLISATQLKADKKEDKGVNPKSKADMAEDSMPMNKNLTALHTLLKPKAPKKKVLGK